VPWPAVGDPELVADDLTCPEGAWSDPLALFEDEGLVAGVLETTGFWGWLLEPCP
jgi:hypothetical protein